MDLPLIAHRVGAGQFIQHGLHDVGRTRVGLGYWRTCRAQGFAHLKHRLDERRCIAECGHRGGEMGAQILRFVLSLLHRLPCGCVAVADSGEKLCEQIAGRRTGWVGTRLQAMAPIANNRAAPTEAGHRRRSTRT